VSEVARVLAPGGLFLLGMPSVSKAIAIGFRAIGFKGVDEHHITPPAKVAARFDGAGLRVLRTGYLDLPFQWPLGMRLYHDWLLQKTASPSARG
jgi:hypothetical protein